MYPVMVVRAEKNAVLEVGAADITIPPANVMGLGVTGWVWAAGPGAPAVALGESELLGRRVQPFRPTQVEDFAFSVEDHRNDVRVGGKPAGCARCDGRGDRFDLRTPLAIP